MNQPNKFIKKVLSGAMALAMVITSAGLTSKPVEAAVGDSIGVSQSTRVYSNASDAKAKRNYKTTYAAGNYYVYKEVEGATNITKSKGSAGGWVNNQELKLAKKTDAYYSFKIYSNASDAAKKINSKGTYAAGMYYVYKETSTAVNLTKVAGRAGGWITNAEFNRITTSKASNFKLSASTKIYTTAADAIDGRNAKGTYAAGDYYIYKTYGKALNISKTPGKAGAWVVINTIVLDLKTPVYSNAADAVAGRNSVTSYSPGVYYVYKETSGAMNISKTSGKAGGWVPKANLPKDPYVIVDPVKPIETKDPEEVVKKFRLVLDAGHGPGRTHNRGGVLFNEGDQNFKFMQEVIKAANKYQGVEIFLTRKTNNQDPSLSVRARMYKDADVFLSLHTNAGPSNVRGVEISGSNNNTKHKMAQEIVQKFSEIMNTPNRGVKYQRYSDGKFTRTPSPGTTDYWGVIGGNTADEKFLIESAFHTNLRDSKEYLDHQKDLAEALMATFAKHYGLKLK